MPKNPIAALRARRADRAASVEGSAAEERVRSVPRRALKVVGFVLCALLLCIPAALCATPAAWLFPLTLALALALSAGWLAVIRRSVSVEVECPSGTAQRGGSCSFVVRMSNASRLPAPRVEATCYVTDLFGAVDSTTQVAAALGPKKSAETVVDVKLPHLGSFACGVSRAEARDLIGAFSAEVPCEGAEAQVSVTPKPVDVGDPDLDTTASDDSKLMFRPVISDDMDYAGVREYRYGDPMKSVHWNLTSRNPGGVMYTRLFEVNATPSLSVVVDGGAAEYSNDGLMSVLDGSVEASCALLEDSLERGIDSKMTYPLARGGMSGWRGGAKDQLVTDIARPSLEAAAGFDALEALAAECTSNHGAGNVCWVSSRVPLEAVELLAALRGRRRHAMAVVVVPAGSTAEDEKAREAALKAAKRLTANGIAWRTATSNEQGTSLQGVGLR